MEDVTSEEVVDDAGSSGDISTATRSMDDAEVISEAVPSLESNSESSVDNVVDDVITEPPQSQPQQTDTTTTADEDGGDGGGGKCLTDDERMALYEKGANFKRLGNPNHALLCFLDCLRGLQPGSWS